MICGGRRLWYLAGGFVGAGPSGVSGGAISPFFIAEGLRLIGTLGAFLLEFSSSSVLASVFGGTERGLIAGAFAFFPPGCWGGADPREGAGRGGGVASFFPGCWGGADLREGAGRGGGFAEPREGAVRDGGLDGTEPREGAVRGGGLDGTEPREGAGRGFTGGVTTSPVGTAVATGISVFFSSSTAESFEGLRFGSDCFGRCGALAGLRGGGFAIFAFDMTGMLGSPFSFL